MSPEPEAEEGQELVPVSVRLGAVVPPEDPEDWTRPLTWAAAAGMLSAPAVAGAWFLLWPPAAATEPSLGTWLVAAALAGGAALTGATQQGRLRALTATLAAALLAALLVVIAALVSSGERQAGVASPELGHAVAAAVGGLAGAALASLIAAILAAVSSRPARALVAAAAGAPVAAGVAIGLFLT